MNDDLKQQLSTLMDGEIDHHSDGTIDKLVSSAALRETWWRYHLISAALNRDLPDKFDRHLADRITASISSDSVIYARNRFLTNRLFKPLAGFAIAASVATVAIIGVQRHSSDVPGQPGMQVVERTPAYNFNSNNIQSYTFPVSANAVSTQVEPVDGNAGPNPQFSSYLVNYNEFQTSQNGVQGIIPYVRIIANEDDQ